MVFSLRSSSSWSSASCSASSSVSQCSTPQTHLIDYIWTLVATLSLPRLLPFCLWQLKPPTQWEGNKKSITFSCPLRLASVQENQGTGRLRASKGKFFSTFMIDWKRYLFQLVFLGHPSPQIEIFTRRTFPKCLRAVSPEKTSPSFN